MLISQLFKLSAPLHQRRVNNMKLKKSLLLLIILGSTFIACSHKPLTPDHVSQISNNGNDYIVLIHGLMNSSRRMGKFEAYFSQKGFQVLNIDYPSNKYPIETLSDQYLKPVVEAIPLNPGQKVHFITHSMGGLLLRYYLSTHSFDQVGHVVMISPPNHGSEWADLLLKSKSARKVAGPAAFELRTRDNDFFKKLGPIQFKLGIIAGKKSYGKHADRYLPGEDDGMVTVKSMKLKGMLDFIVLNEHHRGLTWNQEAMLQSYAFIQNSRFHH